MGATQTEIALLKLKLKEKLAPSKEELLNRIKVNSWEKRKRIELSKSLQRCRSKLHGLELSVSNATQKADGSEKEREELETPTNPFDWKYGVRYWVLALL